MAVTIVRTPWIDDDGSGTTGTVLNNAIKTELYSQIDGALAQLAPGTNGLLNITALGENKIVAGGSGGQILRVANTLDGAGNFSSIQFEAASTYGGLYAWAPSYASIGANLANSTLLMSGVSGGLGIQAAHGSGAIRFYTGGSTERMRMDSGGHLWVNTLSQVGPAMVQIVTDTATTWGLGIKSVNDAAGGFFAAFVNQGGTTIGSISYASAVSVAYNTTSDQRLKEDLGVAEDLTALRAVVVHDFIWSAHGGHDRGVFAQETFPVFPRAISVGSPGTDLSKPWMTDYSKFVPDLIVGWQEHDRRLARLESLAERT